MNDRSRGGPASKRKSGVASGAAEPVKGLPLLKLIGDALDDDVYPVVGENGLVMPAPGHTIHQAGKARDTDVERQEAGTERPSSWKGAGPAADGTTAARTEALILGQRGLSDEIKRDLVGAAAAYPAVRLRFAPPVAWLVCPITPIRGLRDQALLVTAYSMVQGALLPGRRTSAASWAWWDVGIWIGPRHTNVPDGSICAYEPRHGTWTPGKGLLLWMDLHAVWIARQLYLRTFNRWPGDQVLHTAYERLTEHRPGELCGCGSLRRYDSCHREADLSMGSYARSREYRAQFGEGDRRPDLQALQILRTETAEVADA